MFLAVFGSAWWSMALALAGAIALMHVTRTVHPPAGSNPVIVMLGLPGWGFLLMPTLLGANIIVAVALAFNNPGKDRRFTPSTGSESGSRTGAVSYKARNC